MPIKLVNRGIGNVVDISPELMLSLNGSVLLEGDDNFISIAAGAISPGFLFQLRNGSSVRFGRSTSMGRLFVHADRGSRLTVGDNVGFNGSVRLQMHEAGSITIGNFCLFAGDVEVTISDMHSVIDVKTGRRINPAGDIALGERVWVGMRAIVLKNVTIGDGSVIAAAAVVTKSVPAYSLAAGNPARIVRSETTWEFELKDTSNPVNKPE